MKTVQILNHADEVIASFTESFFRARLYRFCTGHPQCFGMGTSEYRFFTGLLLGASGSGPFNVVPRTQTKRQKQVVDVNNKTVDKSTQTKYD